jgi:hypothetical protein
MDKGKLLVEQAGLGAVIYANRRARQIRSAAVLEKSNSLPSFPPGRSVRVAGCERSILPPSNLHG